MECLECQFDNPAEMQFCGKCGAKLNITCPQCQFSNPPQFAFCGKCGADGWVEKYDEVPEPPANTMEMGMRILQEKGKLEEFIKINTL